MAARYLVNSAWLSAYVIVRAAWHFCRRVFIAEPLLKASCRAYGTRVRTDIYAHHIHGQGDLIVGDDVLIDGKSTFTFGSVDDGERDGDGIEQRPRLTIGSHTGIGHDCNIMVWRNVSIGSHCRIAARVWIFDAVAPAAHLPDAIKPVTIQDNVWIGGGAIIFPGVTIGEGSIVSAGAVVTAGVPPYSIVAGHPARRVGALNAPAAAAIELQRA
jgi:acetyltransferase-like isoleucine patch superfamily enzyme